MPFAENLVNLQKHKGVTNYRLAKDLGVRCTSVQNWRDGRMPRLHHAHAVAKYFGKSVEEMMK